MDNVSLEEFGGSLRGEITTIQLLLRDETFRFSPLKPFAVKKGGDRGFRPLLIPTVRDRVVHRALLNEILPRVRPRVSYLRSHAFTDRKGVQTAIAQLRDELARGNRVVLTVDVVNFFPSVDQVRLFTELAAILPDDSLSFLLDQVRDWRIGPLERLPLAKRACFPLSGHGLPQGCALSPLLSNFYLRDLDKTAEAEGYTLIRYADDIAIPVGTQADADRAYLWLKEAVDRVALTIPPLGSPKSRVQRFGIGEASGVEYLGCYLVPRGSEVHVKPSRHALEDAHAAISDFLAAESEDSLSDRYRHLTHFLNGWLGTYSAVCDTRQLRIDLVEHAAMELGLLFRDRGLIAEASLTVEQREFLGVNSLFLPRQARPRRR